MYVVDLGINRKSSTSQMCVRLRGFILQYIMLGRYKNQITMQIG